MRNVSVRKFSVGALLVGTTLAGSILTADAANAAPRHRTFNRAKVELSGGNARALASCVNVARAYARSGKPVPTAQSNRCRGASAVGGDVVVDDVKVDITQVGDGGRGTANEATVILSGGDATAIAACINYATGRSTTVQRNACAGARAQGGDVKAEDLTITVVQAS